MRIIPDIPPKLFTLSAIAVGYILIDDTTANEQNALGNWLMLTAQVLCTNAYYKQVQAERGITNQKTGTNYQSNSYSVNNENCYNSNINSSNNNANNYSEFMNGNNKNNINANSDNDNVNNSDTNINETIAMIKKMINAMREEINNLENNN